MVRGAFIRRVGSPGSLPRKPKGSAMGVAAETRPNMRAGGPEPEVRVLVQILDL